MPKWTRLATAVAAVAVAWMVVASRAIIHGQSSVARITATANGDLRDLRAWDIRTERMIRDGELQLRLERQDTLLAGRMHERYAQFYQGVPVFGADIARQIDDTGVTISIFGVLYEGIDLDVTPRLAAADAKQLIENRAGAEVDPQRLPQLVILPKDDGSYALTYREEVFLGGDSVVYFIDARTGEAVFQYSNLQTQAAAVGSGTGVLGDQKKVSAQALAGTYVASDRLRPPDLLTYNLRSNFARTASFFNGTLTLTSTDLASASGNDWTDVAAVDAHVYEGYVYDYYFKRLNRRGLDNNNVRIVGLVHPVPRDAVLSAPPEILLTFYLNAFYNSLCRCMVYGEGLPPNLAFRGQRWNYLAGALDVVGHELSHAVTDASSRLIYLNESGALNEAFSDFMGVAVEFFYQQPGTGPQGADYLIGEDVITPGGLRSLADPRAYGHPDNYRLRYVGPLDNGGVHTNSGIANNAYYLAIEGGTNRTSGLTVQGVGAANREQIERVFYRGFTQLLPSSATFSVARAVTIQAARDLYGTGSSAERAITQAWTAVGVN